MCNSPEDKRNGGGFVLHLMGKKKNKDNSCAIKYKTRMVTNSLAYVTKNNKKLELDVSSIQDWILADASFQVNFFRCANSCPEDMSLLTSVQNVPYFSEHLNIEKMMYGMVSHPAMTSLLLWKESLGSMVQLKKNI